MNIETLKKYYPLGIVLALVLVLVIAFVSCGKKDSADAGNTQTEMVMDTETETEEVLPETPGKTNLLTGLPTLTDEAVGKRPVAVMVNNVRASFPQYGIAEADIIFEIPVEGGDTRFMAMYGDYTQVPKVCSVRSCRMYFPEFSEGFDAVYVNWGMSEAIRDYIKSLNLTNYDGTFNTGKLFDRDQERRASGVKLEHTGYFNGPGLAAAMEKREERTDIEPKKRDTAFNFYGADEVVKPKGEECLVVEIDYGVAEPTFTYDEKTNTYLKDYNGKPQIDGVTGTQLAFTNVIILETNIGAHPNGTHRDVKWIEGGTGYYISNGVAQEITWSKASIKDRILLFDAEGKELTINAGKSYIGISYPGKITFGEEDE